MTAIAVSYQSTEDHVPFLRIEAARVRVALPYSTLLSLTLSADGTTLILIFASTEVTVKGMRLHEVFCAIAKGQVEALFARNPSEQMLDVSGSHAPFISEIRLSSPDESKSA